MVDGILGFLFSFTTWVTILDIILFLYVMSITQNSSEELNLFTLLIQPNSRVFLTLGGLNFSRIFCGHQFTSILTHFLLHNDLIQLFFSIRSHLSWTGTFERRWGFLRTAVVYALAGAGAGLLALGFARARDVLLGSSGALHGVMGAYIIGVLSEEGSAASYHVLGVMGSMALSAFTECAGGYLLHVLLRQRISSIQSIPTVVENIAVTLSLSGLHAYVRSIRGLLAMQALGLGVGICVGLGLFSKRVFLRILGVVVFVLAFVVLLQTSRSRWCL